MLIFGHAVANSFEQLATFYLPSLQFNPDLTETCQQDLQHLERVLRHRLLWPTNVWAITSKLN